MVRVQAFIGSHPHHHRIITSCCRRRRRALICDSCPAAARRPDKHGWACIQQRSLVVPRAKSPKSSPDQASSVDVDATILAIALPSLGALLIDPILGAVDTAYVGRMEVRDLGGLAVASAAFI